MIEIIEARVDSLSVENGGNPKPFSTGYRALLRFQESSDNQMHAVEVSPKQNVVAPGKSSLCVIRFLHPEFNNCDLSFAGSKIELLDGNSVRATGEIISV